MRHGKEENGFHASETALGRQGSFNPGSGLFGRLEQGRVLGVALAEPGFQVPPPLVLGIMVRPARRTNTAASWLSARTSLPSVSWPSMSTRIGINEMSRGIAFAFHVGAKGQCQMAGHPENKFFG